MTDHPSTYHGDPKNTGFDWDDRAALHRKDDGDGVLDGMKAIRRGTFAEMVGHVMALPEEEREKYVIEKAGDREYHAGELPELAARDDYPN